ncbi:hypothetical protein E2C01_079489 [Portunus trituberculatus]|uniref:Uncharacterized protein n=1 Tax=Portunus trituberculatus TaxID=210409 RepID=A0A5B7IJP2_PORTR|nr:hypothetical protein [Portunus trituberculatus]
MQLGFGVRNVRDVLVRTPSRNLQKTHGASTSSRSMPDKHRHSDGAAHGEDGGMSAQPLPTSGEQGR